MYATLCMVDDSMYHEQSKNQSSHLPARIDALPTSSLRDASRAHTPVVYTNSLKYYVKRAIHSAPAEGVSLAEQVAHVPEEPGCYLWKNVHDTVIYVGKAKNLRARMTQYVQLSDDRLKIPRMMLEVARFDYIVVETEHEALVLERNLIGYYKPYYNVDFKDDKSYPYIALTMGTPFPAIKYTREQHDKTSLYFGPYTDSHAARETIEILRKAAPICATTCPVWRKMTKHFAQHPEDVQVAQLTLATSEKSCFDYHVGKAPGVCVGAISREEYAQHVALVRDFLRGKRTSIYETLTQQMHDAAADLAFEQAARIKRRLDVLSSLQDSQQVVLSSNTSADVIGFYRQETISAVCVFIVREGSVIRANDFILNSGMDVPEVELQESFIKRYYEKTDDIPAEIQLSCALDDECALTQWLSCRAGHACSVHVPQRGEKKKLLETAMRNAQHALVRYMVRTGYSDDRTNTALLELESALALPAIPQRIECFDISTLHGYFTVASMVVFINGKPAKHLYRHFKIRTKLDEANDFVSMSEVLGRRYSAKNLANSAFGPAPQLLVLDGGKPQLTAALTQLKALGISLNVCGLAKSDEEVFVPWDTTPIVLPSGSASLYLIKYIRDESHRFAITFHRYLRDKAMSKSILDEVEGVGPKRKKQLLAHFGSMKRLRSATVADIEQVAGIPKDVARAVWQTLQTW